MENKRVGRMVDNMKVLERAIMPDGTEIQLEEWDCANFYGLGIGVYPLAKRNSKDGWLIKLNESFRLFISSNMYQKYTNDDVKADFEALRNGEKNLEDLATHFWNGEKDMWYLEMNVEYKGW